MLLVDLEWAFLHGMDGQRGSKRQEAFREDFKNNRNAFMQWLLRERKAYRERAGVKARESVRADQPATREAPDEGTEAAIREAVRVEAEDGAEDENDAENGGEE